MPDITENDDKTKCEKWVGSRWGSKEVVYKTYKLTLLQGFFLKIHYQKIFNYLTI